MNTSPTDLGYIDWRELAATPEHAAELSPALPWYAGLVMITSSPGQYGMPYWAGKFPSTSDDGETRTDVAWTVDIRRDDHTGEWLIDVGVRTALSLPAAEGLAVMMRVARATCDAVDAGWRFTE